MSDLSAGTLVQAFDYPKLQEAVNDTAIGNITSTSYTSDSSCTTKFIAPSTGRVMVSVNSECRDNSSTNYVRTSVSITDPNGNEVVGPDAYGHGTSSIRGALDFETRCKTFLVEGLTPGTEYLLTLQYRVSGGSSADIDTKHVIIWPAT